jgi:hypothetical protein
MNRSTSRSLREAREFAARILDDPKVQARILLDAQTGEMSPQVFTQLMAYRWGKPVERLEISEGEMDLTELTNEELAELSHKVAEAFLALDDKTETRIQ